MSHGSRANGRKALYYSLYSLSITNGMPLCLVGGVCEYARGSMSGSRLNAGTLGAGAVGSIDYGYPLQCLKPYTIILRHLRVLFPLFECSFSRGT